MSLICQPTSEDIKHHFTCPFSGVTNYGRVRRKVPESDARSVERPYSGVTNSGRVWRKEPESDARSVECPYSGVTNSGRVRRKEPENDARSATSSIAFRHLPPKDVVNQCSESALPSALLRPFPSQKRTECEAVVGPGPTLAL